MSHERHRSALVREVRTQCFHSETGFGPGFRTARVAGRGKMRNQAGSLTLRVQTFGASS